VEIYPGLPVGGELNWPNIPRGFAATESYYKNFVMNDPSWSYTKMDYDADLAKAEEVDARVGRIAAVDPNLTAFKNRGGKLIQYHGFGEPEIPPQGAINYRASVISRMGQREVDEFYRLFFVPGMAHCRGGVGAADQFDAIAAIDQWVEKGIAPNRIIASRVTDGRVDRTRPLCPYPQVARYTGTGSTDEAANFACVNP
jgi:feruloyl esterase